MVSDSAVDFWAKYYPRAEGWVREFPRIFTAEAINQVLNTNIPDEVVEKAMAPVELLGLPYVRVVTGDLANYIRHPENNCLYSSWMYRTLRSAPVLDYGYMVDALEGIEGANEVLPSLREAITERARNAQSCFSLKRFAKECIGAECENIFGRL